MKTLAKLFEEIKVALSVTGSIGMKNQYAQRYGKKQKDKLWRKTNATK